MNPVNLPAPPGTIGQTYMTQLVRQITDLFRRCHAITEADPFVTLQSPDGRSWNVTVDNAGVLHTAVNTGQINPAGGHQP